MKLEERFSGIVADLQRAQALTNLILRKLDVPDPEATRKKAEAIVLELQADGEEP